MNIFYAPPSQIHGDMAELLDQEAQHASKVMRMREGDRLIVVDGKGGRYEGPIRRITKKSVQIELEEHQQFDEPVPKIILGMGIIKKRDRLEFAIEKAVELGAWHVALFRSDHGIKENVRMDRLNAIAISAMKQSLHTYLPAISMHYSVEEVMDEFYDAYCLMAHEKADTDRSVRSISKDTKDKYLLLVGPEGGFSPEEVEKATVKGAKLVSLGPYRLRAETAALATMSQFVT
ncbi:16S rRNA (uracil(1498)-N(3))-methyltransferase [Aliifodinibius salicampi]|uniref:Ribosomal RNA small subunit methyltransferase E n=1 Tax=Fodinibius salicampi TaxID=1920655 RepID=A0ABT3PU37_9BACT|nr:16S rRNA (uracil(1498)-N(3))-methyltransferase [Fodinibius salicampi]MCW9711365.1 16S rRNA (uracil(1498)-N(3))-methyltransferase [Fodinibius salicampi]